MRMTALLSALTASDKHSDDCISAHPHAASLLLTVQACRKVPPHLRQKCLFQQSFTRRKIYWRYYFSKTCKVKQARLDWVPYYWMAVSPFLISNVSNLPNFEASSRENRLNVHFISLALMIKAKKKKKKKTPKRATTNCRNCPHLFYPPKGVVTSPVRGK